MGVLPALVPIGAPPAPTMAALVLCHVILGVIWLGICTLAVAGGASVLGRPSVRRWLDRVTGAVLLGFAARLALDAALGPGGVSPRGVNRRTRDAPGRPP